MRCSEFSREPVDCFAAVVVVSQWEKPQYEEWGDRTAWRLFNAVTFALAGRVAENPGSTRTLHNVIDGVCEHVH